MAYYPPRKSRTRKRFYEPVKKETSVMFKIGAILIIFLVASSLTNSTYTIFTDSDRNNSNTFAAMEDFCKNEKYALKNKTECKCKGNDKENTGDKDDKDCGENGDGEEIGSNSNLTSKNQKKTGIQESIDESTENKSIKTNDKETLGNDSDLDKQLEVESENTETSSGT